MILSILICSLRCRGESLMRLTRKLRAQASEADAESLVEILVEQDDGELLIGTKRNLLVGRSHGEYVCFVDDDDDVTDDYIKRILGAICSSRPDCVGIEGRILFHRKWHVFKHSTRYKRYSRDRPNRLFFRMPNHLNPVRREIAARHPFSDKNHGEDSDYAHSLLSAGVLKTEVYLEGPIYIYTPAGELKRKKKPR